MRLWIEAESKESSGWTPKLVACGSRLSSETQAKYASLRITKINQCSQLWLHDLLPMKLDTIHSNEDQGDNEGENGMGAAFIGFGKEETALQQETVV